MSAERAGAPLNLLLVALFAFGASALPAAGQDGVQAGRSALQRGDLSRAVGLLDRALSAAELSPGEEARILNLRGLAHDGLGAAAAARSDFDRAIALKPDYAAAYYHRANLRRSEGDVDAAVADYDSALQHQPELYQAYYNRAAAQLEAGRIEAARSDLERYLAFQPDDALARRNHGITEFLLGRFAEAARDLEASVKGEGTDIYHAIWLHLARRRAGRSGGWELALAADELAPEDWPRPVAALLLGRGTAEVVAAAAAEGDAARRCEAYFYLGQYHLLRGEAEQAAAHFRRAAETGLTAFVEYRAARVELERGAR